MVCWLPGLNGVCKARTTWMYLGTRREDRRPIEPSSPIFPLFHTISCHLTIQRIHGYVRLMQSRSHLGYASRREATESTRAKCGGDCDDVSDVLGAYQIHACSLRLEDTNSADHHVLQELRPSTHKGYTGIAHKRRCWQF